MVTFLVFIAGFCCGWSGFALAISRIEKEREDGIEK